MCFAWPGGVTDDIRKILKLKAANALIKVSLVQILDDVLSTQYPYGPANAGGEAARSSSLSAGPSYHSSQWQLQPRTEQKHQGHAESRDTLPKHGSLRVVALLPLSKTKKLPLLQIRRAEDAQHQLAANGSWVGLATRYSGGHGNQSRSGLR